MKYSTVLLLLLGLQLSLRATHMVGGDIHYECLGNDQYLIVLTVYRDCQTGISGFDDPACIGIFNANGILVENVQISLSSAVVSDLDINTGDPCLQAPEGLCVEQAIYDATVTLEPSAGGYTLSYQRCCRNTTIINCESNDDIGMTLTTTIPDESIAICNSNPAFTQIPPLVICLNDYFVFDHSATDIDGDSLVYEFCNPLLENSNLGNYICPPSAPPYPLLDFYPQYSAEYPLDADPAFEIDPVTGVLTGTPIQLGKYVVGICVKEYRNGVLITETNRDFQFNIAPCLQNVIADIDVPAPCQGLEIAFGNGSSNGTTYEWNFGDATTDADTSSAENPVYTFPEPGVYEVSLLVNEGFACADSSVVQIPVFNPVDVDIIAEGPVCVNGSWSFNYNVEGEYEPGGSFEWDFNGGDPVVFEGEFPPAISYSSQGNYNVELYVNDGFCEGEDLILIEVPPLPVADIVPQVEFCEGLTVFFENNSSNASTYAWDFGDMVAGDTSTEENPSYTYGQYGTYVVTLVVDPGSPCSYTDQQEFVVLPPDPIEALYVIAEPNICDTVPKVDVLWYGLGASSIEWNFGDGATSEESSTLHEYEEPGIYTVTLTAYSEVCDFEETVEQEISIGLGPVIADVIVPNIFTPSGDNKNEYFRMHYKNEDNILPPYRSMFDYLDLYDMKVYDRWGILMFDSVKEETNLWDGTYNGDVTEGVYYYILNYKRKCIDQSVISREGHLHVVRKKN